MVKQKVSTIYPFVCTYRIGDLTTGSTCIANFRTEAEFHSAFDNDKSISWAVLMEKCNGTIVVQCSRPTFKYGANHA